MLISDAQPVCDQEGILPRHKGKDKIGKSGVLGPAGEVALKIA